MEAGKHSLRPENTNGTAGDLGSHSQKGSNKRSRTGSKSIKETFTASDRVNPSRRKQRQETAWSELQQGRCILDLRWRGQVWRWGMEET